jgi:hypothetical protein
MQVRVLFGRWQDVAGQLEKYDGIFFDTYSEHYLHMRAFHDLLPQILKKDGIYSFFNGLAPRCPFFSRCDGNLDPVKQWLSCDDHFYVCALLPALTSVHS